jgi:hypothetical protein
MLLQVMGYKLSGPNSCIGPRSDCWGQSFRQALEMSGAGASANGRHEATLHFLRAHQAPAHSAQLPVRACLGQCSNSLQDADGGQPNQQQGGDYGQQQQHQQPLQFHQERQIHGTCYVCRAAPATMLVVACGHLCMCAPCAEQVRRHYNKCPRCNQASLDGNGELMLIRVK